jgi:hypothetical protein
MVAVLICSQTGGGFLAWAMRLTDYASRNDSAIHHFAKVGYGISAIDTSSGEIHNHVGSL